MAYVDYTEVLTFYNLGTYCGQMRNLVVFSTGDSLYVTFHTLKRTAQVFNRGFYGVYDFSDDYVKLGKQRIPWDS